MKQFEKSVKNSHILNMAASSSWFLDEDEFEYFEERAGILEYEAGLLRKDAERIAMELVIKRRQVYTLAE